ncbi:MAG: hypothetical protein KAH57_00675, partial [Thermoplasmata archaeon]|nr:hypothetical protein [Thermoplasmata archaeon]
IMKKKKVEEPQVGPENDVGVIEPQPLEDNIQEYHENLDILGIEVPVDTIAFNEVGIPNQGVPEEPAVSDEAVAPIQPNFDI